MRIHSLKTKNFLGIGTAEFRFSPMTIVCGLNRSGKSSLRDAIGLAMTGETIRGVFRKKDLGYLVSEGSKTGEVRVEWSNGDGLGPYPAVMTLPNGKAVGERPDHDKAQIILSADRFTRMSHAERLDCLMKIVVGGVNTDNIRARLEMRGCDISLADEGNIPALALAGFPEAENETKHKASECRGRWKAITSETYGSIKAENWEAPCPDMPWAIGETPPDVFHAKLAGDELSLASEVIAAERRIFEAEMRQKTLDRLKLRLPEVESKVKTIPSLIAKIEKIDSDISTAMDEERAAYGKVTAAINSKTTTYRCPCCDAILSFDGANIVEHKANDAEHGPVDTNSLRQDHNARKQVLSGLRSELRRHHAELAAARQAEENRAGLIAQYNELTSHKEGISQLKGALAEQHKKLSGVRDSLAAWKEYINGTARAKERTEAASAAHVLVQEWSRIGEAMSPTGIQEDLVADALSPVNRAIRQQSEKAGWECPTINADMNITAEGRPYRLLSESEQWRANTLIATAISSVCGEKLIVLDRLDVLIDPDRGKALMWLFSLMSEGYQVIVMASLKSAPNFVNENIGVIWMESRNRKEKKAE